MDRAAQHLHPTAVLPAVGSRIEPVPAHVNDPAAAIRNQGQHRLAEISVNAQRSRRERKRIRRNCVVVDRYLRRIVGEWRSSRLRAAVKLGRSAPVCGQECAEQGIDKVEVGIATLNDDQSALQHVSLQGGASARIQLRPQRAVGEEWEQQNVIGQGGAERGERLRHVAQLTERGLDIVRRGVWTARGGVNKPRIIKHPDIDLRDDDEERVGADRPTQIIGHHHRISPRVVARDVAQAQRIVGGPGQRNIVEEPLKLQRGLPAGREEQGGGAADGGDYTIWPVENDGWAGGLERADILDDIWRIDVADRQSHGRTAEIQVEIQRQSRVINQPGAESIGQGQDLVRVGPGTEQGRAATRQGLTDRKALQREFAVVQRRVVQYAVRPGGDERVAWRDDINVGDGEVEVGGEEVEVGDPSVPGPQQKGAREKYARIDIALVHDQFASVDHPVLQGGQAALQFRRRAVGRFVDQEQAHARKVERADVLDPQGGVLRGQNRLLGASGRNIEIREITHDAASFLHGQRGHLAGERAIKIRDDDLVTAALAERDIGQEQRLVGGVGDGNIVEKPLEGEGP